MVNLTGPVEKEQEIFDRIVELSLLYDFYGALLKEHKRQIFEDYVQNDLSLSEIAKEQGTSRQAVHDTVKRCSRELAGYEEKLHLLEKFGIIKGKVHAIHQMAKQIQKTGAFGDIIQIEALSNEILDVL